MPGSEEGAAVGTETSLVDKRSREVVPRREWTSVNTGNLVVAQLVAFVLAHEPLHAEQIQVPLVGVLLQLTDFKTRVRLPAIAVAVSPPDSAGAADTADGKVGTNATLALRQSLGDVLNVRFDLTVAALVVVVGTMLRGDGDLEEGKESDQHGHHALGFAEVGHYVERNGAFNVNDRMNRVKRKRLKDSINNINGGCVCKRAERPLEIPKRSVWKVLRKKLRRQRLRRIKGLA